MSEVMIRVFIDFDARAGGDVATTSGGFCSTAKSGKPGACVALTQGGCLVPFTMTKLVPASETVQDTLSASDVRDAMRRDGFVRPRIVGSTDADDKMYLVMDKYATVLPGMEAYAIRAAEVRRDGKPVSVASARITVAKPVGALTAS